MLLYLFSALFGYLFSALFGYLIHRFVSGDKAYFLPPLGGLLVAGLTTLIAVFAYEKVLSTEINNKQIVDSLFQTTFLGTFFTYLTLWTFRREAKKKQEKEKSNS